MTKAEEYIRIRLFQLQDKKYKEFSSKLIPTVDADLVIGVRTPALRKLAKEFSKNPLCDEFMQSLPHSYLEENNLHAFLIEQIKDYDKAVKEVDLFLPYVDNWATCDQMSPKIFRKHPDELLEKIGEWIKSERTYTVRFAIEMLMTYYLDEWFKSEYLALVCNVRSDEYYVKMMIAWFFATALAKQYDASISYIENRKLEKWVHNKTIQKACESFRVDDEKKAYLRSLKIK
ncbi:MAG: DNA alkylation repair protein [Acutalibacteraceae bacterium]